MVIWTFKRCDTASTHSTHWPVNFSCIWVLKNKLKHLETEYICLEKTKSWHWAALSSWFYKWHVYYLPILLFIWTRSRLFGFKTSQCGRWAAAFHQLNSLSTCQSGASKPHSPSSSLFLSVDLSSTSTSRSMKKWVRSFGGWLQSRSKMELMWFVFLELNSNW